MAYTLGNKCVKNLCKRIVLLQLIIENVVTCFIWNVRYACLLSLPGYNDYSSKIRFSPCLLAMLCVSGAYTAMQCLSRCMSVTFVYCVETSKRILKLLYHLVDHHSSFSVPNLPTRTPLAGRRMQVGYEKRRLLTDISLYLGNDSRQGHSYYGTPIGTRTRSIEW